jgi:3-methyladenine DNA glycosylase Tag
LAGPSQSGIQRCAWSKGGLHNDCHDREWGVPVRDDRRLFEWLEYPDRTTHNGV